jgi:hypothetical protein
MTEKTKEKEVIPNGYFKYGNCEVCSSSLILPLCPDSDKYSKLVWAVYMAKTKATPKLCYTCQRAYDEVNIKEFPKFKRGVTKSSHIHVVKVSDYTKAVELGIIEPEEKLVI